MRKIIKSTTGQIFMKVVVKGKVDPMHN